MAVWTEQSMDALEKANEVRVARAAVKAELKAGRVSLAKALADPCCGSMRIFDLLMVQRGVGRQRVLSLLLRHEISGERRVRDLTVRQRGLLGAR